MRARKRLTEKLHLPIVHTGIEEMIDPRDT